MQTRFGHRPVTLRLIRSSERPAARTAEPTQPDPIARAIALMEADLSARLCVTTLARRVGLSRAVFARRFVEKMGMSPMRYLTQRRMERAAELLRDADASLAKVAEWVGYTSEFAFNRAFKRHFLVAPGGFRRALIAAGFAGPPRFRAAA